MVLMGGHTNASHDDLIYSSSQSHYWRVTLPESSIHHSPVRPTGQVISILGHLLSDKHLRECSLMEIRHFLRSNLLLSVQCEKCVRRTLLPMRDVAFLMSQSYPPPCCKVCTATVCVGSFQGQMRGEHESFILTYR